MEAASHPRTVAEGLGSFYKAFKHASGPGLPPEVLEELLEPKYLARVLTEVTKDHPEVLKSFAQEVVKAVADADTSTKLKLAFLLSRALKPQGSTRNMAKDFFFPQASSQEGESGSGSPLGSLLLNLAGDFLGTPSSAGKDEEGKK